ncbi:MAG: hypothetical protein AAB221_06990, partial [Bacteroidota bacterium]
MPVLVTTKVKGQTPEGYDQVSAFLHELVKKAPGFILHTAYQGEEDWMVVEVWDSKENADRFFSDNVAPNLPKG